MARPPRPPRRRSDSDDEDKPTATDKPDKPVNPARAAIERHERERNAETERNRRERELVSIRADERLAELRREQRERAEARARRNEEIRKDDEAPAAADRAKFPDQPKVVLGTRPGPTRVPGLGDTVDEALGSKPDLDPSVPLLLLPVRIETRYSLQHGELRIRIYPDQVHVHSDEPGITKSEWEAGNSFWNRFDSESKDKRSQQALWRALAERVGPQRAGHVAREVRAGAEPSEVSERPGHAVLLPRRFVALGYRADELLFTTPGDEVPKNLQTSPDPGAKPVELDGSGLSISPGLVWMFDWDQAVKVGMGISIDLESFQDPLAPLTLLVLGVHDNADPDELANEFADVLAMHERSSGLAFVDAGTPTNNTSTEATAYDPRRPGPMRGLEPGRSPVVDFKGTNAADLGHALGLPDAAVLGRIANGLDSPRDSSRSMNLALFEPLMGHYTRVMLGSDADDGLPTRAQQALRRWFEHRLTGGAALPALRIGPQPYGVLPIGNLPTGEKNTTTHQIARLVRELEPEWERSVDEVPRLDPNAADQLQSNEGGEPEPIDVFPAVLSSEPNPARIFSRTLYSGDDDFWSFFGAQALYGWTTNQLIPANHPELVAFSDAAAKVPSVEGQIFWWQLRRDTLPANDPVVGVIDSLLVLLESWQYRQRPHSTIGLPRWNGSITNDDPPRLLDSRFDAEDHEWSEQAVIGDPARASDHGPAIYLEELAQRYRATPGSSDSKLLGDESFRPPLLFQVLDLAEKSLMVKARRNGVASALRHLANLEPAHLDRLFRETLGLVTNRLDAWTTSVANERLEQLRGDLDKPNGGLHIGAWGLVTDLEPSEGTASTGFVHAPSMAHAATAAVLRSAWMSHGSAAADSAAAVDISSSRIRTANWVLDGLRNDQSLGELLGYRFERSLHDAGADHFILDIRRAVISARSAQPSPDGQPYARGETTENDPVDGTELLRLRRTPGIRNLDPAVEQALDQIAGVADAVADAALFEGTHQIVQGNPTRAAAMFDSISLGLSTPPELRAHRTPRGGLSIDHRVVALFPAEAKGADGWSPGLRDRLDPGLDSWVGSLLPHPDEVGFSIAATSTRIDQIRLSELEVSALDMLWLCNGDPSTISPALRSLLVNRLGVDPTATIDTAASSTGASLADFQVLAREIKALVEAGLPATEATLQPPSGEAAPEAGGFNADQLKVVEALWTDFLTALDDSGPDGWQALSLFGWVPGDDAAVTRHRLEMRAEEHQSALRSQRLPANEQTLSVMFSARPSALPVAVHPGGSGSSVTFDGALATDAEVREWIEGIGRVRPTVGRLSATSLLGSLLTGQSTRFAIAQDRISTAEKWAALHRPPTDTGGRLSVCAATVDDWLPGPGEPFCGLVFDQWSEQLPNPDQLTGVAFHFDAPSNRPPQAWLLATLQDDESWSMSTVAQMVLDTFGWAQKRMVAPEDLGDWGHGIPLSIVPGLLRSWAPEEVTQ